jgi:DNA-nicking Smr family endonuclease
MDDFDFPSLSAAAPSSKNKGPSKAGGAKKNKKYQKISDIDSLDGGSHIDLSFIDEDSGSKSNGSVKSSSPVDGLASQLQEKAKISSPPLARQGISYSATAAAAAAKPLTPLAGRSASSTEDTEKQRKAFKLLSAPSTVPWLETGSTLNSAYLKSRAQAIEYAKARNQCFELATQAYLQNEGASASQLSNKGREYNELMMATHREASRQIFNSRHQSMIKSEVKGETWIDLHGLHVDESLAFLDEFMEKLEKELYSGTVYIVTGTGHHSVNKKAKLRPAVIDWLDSWGYVWKEMSLDKIHGGVLAVQVINGKA